MAEWNLSWTNKKYKKIQFLKKAQCNRLGSRVFLLASLQQKQKLKNNKKRKT